MFGAGGDRDVGKRAEMGAVAAKLSDLVIVTDDNPRSEDPAAILEAGPGDIILLAGKGHEQGQIVGNQVRPFDDAAEVRAAVAAL